MFFVQGIATTFLSCFFETILNAVLVFNYKIVRLSVYSLYNSVLPKFHFGCNVTVHTMYYVILIVTGTSF